MNAEIILLALSPLFLAFVLYEFIKHRGFYNLKDSAANAVLALLHQGSDALALVVLMPAFYWLHEYSWFTFELSVPSVLFAFILQDFLYYWFHKASHYIQWLWAAHVVHHSSTRMNFTTAFRQSFMYPLAGMWLFWMPMILIGFDPKVVFIVVALNLAYQFFVHTQMVKKLGWVEKIFNTPSHHRVHHATNDIYIDKNFGGVLIIWDKLFGTYIEERDDTPCKYGIVGQIHTHNPIKIVFHQWQHMFERAWQANNLKGKLKALFGYPTH